MQSVSSLTVLLNLSLPSSRSVTMSDKSVTNDVVHFVQIFFFRHLGRRDTGEQYTGMTNLMSEVLVSF